MFQTILKNDDDIYFINDILTVEKVIRLFFF